VERLIRNDRLGTSHYLRRSQSGKSKSRMPTRYLNGVLFSTIMLLFACNGNTQPPVQYVPLERVAVLHDKLNETSGLAFANQHNVYVHNDSGKKPELYEISLATGEIVREVEIENARNKDWEELAADDDFIYIGDFGNNAGSRDDLRVLKVSRSKASEDTQVKVDKIHFDYPDQKSFKSRRSHDFDCEAMIVYEDSLYLFSKNRESFTTDVYRLPTESGKYSAEKIGSFKADGLITAADLRIGRKYNSLVLLGYQIKGHKYVSFMWLCTEFRGLDFFDGKVVRLDVAPNLQAEAVVWESDTTVLITNEEERAGRGQISRIDLSQYLK
jgi:hypothetical protein